MQRETIGKIECPFCSSSADARKNKKGKLYFSCARCGLVQPALPAFQDWMLEHVQIDTPTGEPARADAGAAQRIAAAELALGRKLETPVQAEAPAKPTPPPKKSVFDYL